MEKINAEEQQQQKTVFKIQLGSNKKSASDVNISPLYKHLSSLGSKLVPIDAFEHLKCYQEAVTKSSTGTSKFELIYGENEYWPVKVKKCPHSGLYQLKLAHHADLASTSSSSVIMLDSSGLNLSSVSDRTASKNMWFFDGSKGIANLKPLGWAKENSRVAKRPAEDADLAALLQMGEKTKNDEDSDDSHKVFEVNSVCEVMMNDGEFVKCRVKRNVNGRLLLQRIDKEEEMKWMFFTDPRLKLNSNVENLASKNICNYWNLNIRISIFRIQLD